MNNSVHNVYASVDENNVVTNIFTDFYFTPSETDVLIESGEGYDYVYGFLERYNLYTEHGAHRLKIVDGEVTERTEEEIAEEIANFPPEPPTLEEKISEIKELNDILYEIEADQEFRICCLEMGMSPDDFDEM